MCEITFNYHGECKVCHQIKDDGMLAANGMIVCAGCFQIERNRERVYQIRATCRMCHDRSCGECVIGDKLEDLIEELYQIEESRKLAHQSNVLVYHNADKRG